MHDAPLNEMNQIQQKRAVVSLVEGNHDDLRVVPLDGDQFLLTAQQAIDACSIATHAVRFQAQFQDLLEMLYKWVEDRKEKISAAFISIDTEGIKLLVVQKEVSADFGLEDELVDLDLVVANDESFELVPFNTLLVPKVGQEVIQSFLSSSGNVIGHQVNAQQG